ncbi:uncharacterized protein LOC119444074 [Dermacentor silvarum]|nr:uncharacterized protein LOC119444074 [Dermacentor silvarum]
MVTMSAPVQALVCLLLVGLSGVSYGQECLKPQSEEVMKKAGQIAAELMKQCVHLLDKHPMPLSMIADAMKTLCVDYAGCHDKHEAMASKPEEYRKLLITCGHPHLVNFFKKQSEFKHDPEVVATEIGTCIMDHIPLTKEMGIATAYWILKIMGAHE